MSAHPRGSTIPLVLAVQRIVIVLATLSAGVLIGACQDEDDEIGTPCDTDDDCSSELICDVHEGQGTCQEPHDH